MRVPLAPVFRLTMIILPTLPLRNAQLTTVYAKRLFSDEQCQQILASAKPDAWQDGAIGGRAGRGAFSIDSYRRMQQQPLAPRNDGFPLNQVVYEASAANSLAWGFALSGLVADDATWLMRYSATNADHYDWHIDIGHGPNASRKLGFSVQLSASTEYDGGDLEFMNVNVASLNLRELGALILFPAFRTHRVTPVTRGLRVAVVGWIHGPSFR